MNYASRLELDSLEQAADLVLDVTGLDCPIPVLRARIALRELAPGQKLLVLATDPHSAVDFQAFSARTRHPIRASGRSGETFFFLLEKAPDSQKR